jgi:hypothetical protein
MILRHDSCPHGHISILSTRAGMQHSVECKATCSMLRRAEVRPAGRTYPAA